MPEQRRLAGLARPDEHDGGKLLDGVAQDAFQASGDEGLSHRPLHSGISRYNHKIADNASPKTSGSRQLQQQRLQAAGTWYAYGASQARISAATWPGASAAPRANAARGRSGLLHDKMLVLVPHPFLDQAKAGGLQPITDLLHLRITVVAVLMG